MRRPSPALAVAACACVIACAGSATAASLITGAQIRNGSLTGADVRDRSRRGRDVAANALTGRNIKGLSGRDVIPNGLDGSDIDESTFETVPQATRATSAQTADALSHARVLRVAANQAPGSASTVAYEGGGLRVQTECTAAGRLVATATPTGAGGFVRAAITHPGAPAATTLVTDNAFSGTDAVNLVAGGADNLSGTITYASPAGDVVTLQYLAQEDAACVLRGNAVHTT